MRCWFEYSFLSNQNILPNEMNLLKAQILCVCPWFQFYIHLQSSLNNFRWLHFGFLFIRMNFIFGSLFNITTLQRFLTAVLFAQHLPMYIFEFRSSGHSLIISVNWFGLFHLLKYARYHLRILYMDMFEMLCLF